MEHTDIQNSLLNGAESRHVELSIPNYEANADYPFSLWLNLFNRFADSKNCSSEWKLLNISKFLRGDAFNFYLQLLSDRTVTWQEAQTLLTNRFAEHLSDPFAEFNDLKLVQFQFDLQKYYDKKCHLGRLASLTTANLISGLNSGLPNELQFYMCLQGNITPEEWFINCSKVNRAHRKFIQLKGNSSTRVTTASTFPVVNSKISASNHRLPTLAASYNDLRISSPRTVSTEARESFSVVQPSVVSATVKPRSPCYYCFDRGLPDPYHFSNQCPNRRIRPEKIVRETKMAVAPSTLNCESPDIPLEDVQYSLNPFDPNLFTINPKN